MTTRTNKSYTLEFKQSSAKLASESDQSIQQTAKDLGINKTSLYGWVAKYAPKSKQPKHQKDEQTLELVRLRKENTILKQERDILKEAAKYFANQK